MPASWCGVVGHKPTFSLVPYTGIVGADHSLDHVGPMARTVADAALTLEVIAGPDPMDPRQQDVRVQPYTEALGLGARGLRIGVLKEGFGLPRSEDDVDEAVREALRVLNELGAETVEVSVPPHIGSGDLMWSMIARRRHRIAAKQRDRSRLGRSLQHEPCHRIGQIAASPVQ